MENTEFEGSLEATEHMDNLLAAVKDRKLRLWCASTDYNYSTKSCSKLAEAIKAVEALIEEIEKAN